MGMWPGVGCEAGRQFPDVTHKDLKSVWEGVFLPDVSDVEQNERGSAISLLMCRMRKTGICHRVQCETAWGFPDVTLREEKQCARVYSLLM